MEIITYDTSIYKTDHSKLKVSNQNEEKISAQKVK